MEIAKVVFFSSCVKCVHRALNWLARFSQCQPSKLTKDTQIRPLDQGLWSKKLDLNSPGTMDTFPLFG